MNSVNGNMSVIKKIGFDFISLVLLWTGFFFLARFLFTKIGIDSNNWLIICSITLFVFTFTYKKLWSFNTIKSIKGVIVLILIFVLLPGTISYYFSLHERNKKLYSYLTAEKKRGWRGVIHQADDSLGFKTVPGAKGFMTFNYGEDIPLAIDSDGFRIPVRDTVRIRHNEGADLLFLGCSFTFGDACYAEETFSHLVSQATGLTYLNGGVCSNGLSQMVLAAEEYIPKYKPKYVILQHSPWLVRRSLVNFAPSHYGTMPNPYFFEKNGKIDIHAPIYITQMFNLDIESIKKESEIEFFRNGGLRYQLKEDWLKWSSKLKLFLGIYDRPFKNEQMADRYGYKRIYEVAHANNTKVIIVNLCWPGGLTILKPLFSKEQDVFFADSDSLLNNYLQNSRSKSFEKEFTHWRMCGNDSIHIDGHPNALANQLISESIIPLIKTKE